MDNHTIEEYGLWDDFLKAFETSIIVGSQALSNNKQTEQNQ